MNTHEHTSKKSFGPGSLIGALLAVVLIVSAIVIQMHAKPSGTADIQVPAITAADHTRGDKNAPVKVIEYSDLECPFCKDFHQTMTQTFAEYGVAGKITWVYRHFPLSQLHKQALPEAVAVECAALQGGDDVFWKMTDTIFQVTRSNDRLDLKTLPVIAVASGVKDLKAFNTCIADKTTLDVVVRDQQGGVEAGAEGTPYTVVVSPAGNNFVINGAFSKEQVQEIIEKALDDK